jgi:hypothetical protein
MNATSTYNAIRFNQSGGAQGFIGSDYGQAVCSTSANGDMVLRADATGTILFASSTTERIRFTSAGNVGIGTSSPASKFHVGTTTYSSINTVYSFGIFGPFSIMYRDNATDTYLLNNAYYTSSNVWSRPLSGGATIIASNSSVGTLDFSVAGTAASGTSISWTTPLSLNTSGATITGTLYINDTSSTILRTSSGYSSGYRAITIGAATGNYNNVALAVDISAVTGGSFSGAGQIFIGNKSILAPNNAGTDWMGVLRATSGEVWIGGATAGGELNGTGIKITSAGLVTVPQDIQYSSNSGYGILSANGNRQIAIFNAGVTFGYAATFSSTATATDFILSSDSRKKTNIQPIKNALHTIRTIDGIIYNSIDGINRRKQSGVIAQTINDVFPYAATFDGEYYGVMYDRLVPLLIEGVKDVDTEVAALKSRIEMLEQKLTQYLNKE